MANLGPYELNTIVAGHFGSLFAGIGGLDLGLERAGWRCSWQVEIDPFCQKVLAKHWPDIRRYGNVKECGSHNLEPVDLICGGFPCQPHSVAGKRRGAADDRNLWPEFLRIIREVRPAWVLAENVPGIVSLYLDTVLADLEGEGYTCWTFNIPACGFNAPHRRVRIFVVAYAEQGASGGGAVARPSNQQGRRPPATEPKSLQPRNGQAYPSIPEQGGQVVADPEGGTVWDDRQDERQTNREINTPDNTSAFGRRSNWWAVEPSVGRVAYGIPNRVDRLRVLGNAVVPQVAEWVGNQILAAERIEGDRKKRAQLPLQI